MNKMIKFVLIFVLINLIAFIAGFFGSIVLLTAKKRLASHISSALNNRVRIIMADWG